MSLPCDERTFGRLIREVVQTLCPTAVAPHLSRIDTKAKHPHSSLYESDRTYFRVSRERAFIRESHCGEFDYTPSNSVSVETFPALLFQSAPLPNEVLKSIWKYIPRLWVLCADIGEGTHQVTAIYRGDPMWPVADRDGNDVAKFESTDELTAALEAIQACEGFDESAWKRFCQKYWDACVIYSAVVEMKGAAIN